MMAERADHEKGRRLTAVGIPFTLPDEPAMVMVHAGQVLLFCVEPSGVRHLAGEAGPGERLLYPGKGFQEEGGTALSWILVPLQEAEISLAALHPASTDPDVLAQAAALLPPWAVLMEEQDDQKRPERLGELLARLAAAWRDFVQQEDRRARRDLRHWEQARRRGLARALVRLAETVGGQGPSRPVAMPHSEMDARVAVIAEACVAMGTPLPADRLVHLDAVARQEEPTSSADGQAAAALFERLLMTAGLFFRRVRLEEHWWRADHGLVILGAESGKPLLAKPTTKGYAVFDADGVTRALGAEQAARLGREAWVLAQRLPEKAACGLGDLLRHAGWDMRRDALRFVGLTAVAGLLSLGTPLATGLVMSRVIPDADHPLLWTLFFGLAAAALAQAGVSLAAGFATVRAEGRAGNRLQEAVWDRLLRLPVSFFRRFDVGDLANRALSVDTIRAMVGMHAVTAITHGVFGLFSLALMIWYDWRLGAVVAALGLLFAGLTWRIGRIVLQEVKTITDDTGRLEALIFQFVQAISNIRVAGAVSAAFQRFAGLYRRILAASRRQQMAAAVLQGLSAVWPIVTFVVLVAAIALVSGQMFAYFRTPTDWGAIAAEHLSAAISAASFIGFYTALGQFSLALTMVAGAVLQLVAVRPWAERLRPLLDERPEDMTGGHRRLKPFRGAIAVHALAFRYTPDSARILDGVSLKLDPGEMVALVGPSGAGKSTIIRLILGFEQPEEGSIFIDGVDLRRLDLGWLRRQIGVVLQDGRLLPGSIFQNIAAGARITRGQAMDAIRMAGMEADLEQMPMGLETMLGEGAVTLSGGQRQRLMIARALVRRPKLVIFDEATSALDNETQAVVTESLNRLAVARLVVAHRLSTIRDADRIYVLDHGRLVEEGRFAELLAKNGLFRRLAARQMITSPEG